MFKGRWRFVLGSASERLVLLTLGALVGCGVVKTSNVQPTAGVSGNATGGMGGGAPAVGAGGISGAGGFGGLGGVGGGVPACPALTKSYGSVRFEVDAADGSVVATSVSDHVTVSSVDTDLEGDLRIVLARPAPNDALTLSLQIPGMPDGYFVVGAEYDLVLDVGGNGTFYPTIDQELTLSQAGRPMVLAANMRAFSGPLYGGPRLPSRLGDVTLAEAGAYCFEQHMICSRDHLAVQVVRGSSSATIVPGQTALVGTLSFTSGVFEFIFDDGVCDEKSQTLMAAFETEPDGALSP